MPAPVASLITFVHRSRGTPTTYSIRAGRPDEIAVLQQIERASGELFRTVGMDAVADDDPAPTAVFAGAAAASRLWVADDDTNGEPVGFAIGIFVGGGPHLEQISVHPAHGRRGVGRALVGAVAAWARAAGGSALTLSTFRDLAWNEAYYAKLGFLIIPEAELTGPLLALRATEEHHGLDVSRRVFMRLPLRTGR